MNDSIAQSIRVEEGVVPLGELDSLPGVLRGQGRWLGEVGELYVPERSELAVWRLNVFAVLSYSLNKSFHIHNSIVFLTAAVV